MGGDQNFLDIGGRSQLKIVNLGEKCHPKNLNMEGRDNRFFKTNI